MSLSELLILRSRNRDGRGMGCKTLWSRLVCEAEANWNENESGPNEFRGIGMGINLKASTSGDIREMKRVSIVLTYLSWGGFHSDFKRVNKSSKLSFIMIGLIGGDYLKILMKKDIFILLSDPFKQYVNISIIRK